VNDTATGPWREALGFIDTLLTANPSERERLLAELAATRPELHTRVRALLDADAEATRTGFMAVNKGREGAAVATLAAGTHLGPYRVVRELGSGGMGEVWLAQRDDGLYQGEVAVKTLHPFFAHGAMRERFLREAQLLGKLAHPNIARLLDAGVSDGVVFLVLEYVRGEALDAYCDARQLGIDARLKLFGEVCAAVAHAHANLVVHRDIKPSNILVTAEGQVKLLDFGIGKIMEPDREGRERTELTRVTGRIFTPEFAAPEQILGEPVTTATDIYSLGTLLYVLLAGTRPFGDLSGTRVEHAVLHDEPRSLSAAAGVNEAIAAHRGLTPPRLRRALAGDLEDIVQLAMRKAPAQRYGSVLGLAEDLARYRRHEPVRARAGSRAYRMNRYVRRHRVAAAAVLGVILASVAGVAGVIYQAREAREQAHLATLEAQKATKVKNYLLQIFEANSTRHPDGAEARKTTAEELMDIATKEIIEDRSQDPDLRLEMMTVLTDINGQMEKFDAQDALGRERIRLAEEQFGEADIRLADALNDRGEYLRGRGRAAEARAAVQRAVQLREAQGDSSSWTRGVSELELGQIELGDWDGKSNLPVEHYERAIAILGKLPPAHELVRAYLGLARAYEFKRDYAQAIERNARGIALAIEVDGPKTISVAGGHQQMARALTYSYRYDEAEHHLVRAVEIFTFIQGADGGFTTNARLDVGRLKNRRGRYLEAIELLAPMLEHRLILDGPDTSWVRGIRGGLATSTYHVGDFARTRQLLDASRASFMKQKNLQTRALVEKAQAALANEEGRHADALRNADDAMRLLAQSPGARSATTYLILLERAEALIGLGRLDEARATLEETAPLLAEFDKSPDGVEGLYIQLAFAGLHLRARELARARMVASDVLARVQAASQRAEAWALEDLAQRRLAAIETAMGNRQAACAALGASIALRSRNALATDPRLIAARKLRATCT
jgi:serine/threonine-protein kinase